MHQAASDAELGYQTVIPGSTYVPDDAYVADLRKAMPEMEEIRAWVKSLGLDYNLWPARPWPLTDDLHPTTWVARQARLVVAEAEAKRPLFLTASFYAPHPPLFPPARYFDSYMEQELPRPAHGDWVKWKDLTPKGTDNGHRVLLEGEALRRAQSGYFGLIQHLDHEIAPLIADFTKRSEDAGRPWAVIVTADHGEMLGEHEFHFNHHSLYDEALRVPLAIRAPGLRAGTRVVDAQVRVLDIPATVLDYLGLDPLKPCEGVDLLGYAEKVRHQSLLTTLYGRVTGALDRGTLLGVRSGRPEGDEGRPFKYIWDLDAAQEHLYDLDADPGEVRDIAAEQPGLVTQAHDLVGREAKQATSRTAEVDPATRNALRALGYME
ncbi:MAG: sulfatase-like hydrolase/transferase [Pseudomonadota bacterium]